MRNLSDRKEYFFQGLVTQDSSVSQSNGPETSSLNGQNFVVCYLPDFQRDFRESSTGALILEVLQDRFRRRNFMNGQHNWLYLCR